MFRIGGLCAGAALVAFSLWLANLGGPAPGLNAGIEPGEEWMFAQADTPAPSTARSGDRGGFSPFGREPAPNEFKTMAVDLMQKAREQAAAGDLSSARRNALRANAMPNVTWNAGEVSPKQFLESLDRPKEIDPRSIAPRGTEAPSMQPRPSELADDGFGPSPVTNAGASSRFVDPEAIKKAGLTEAKPRPTTPTTDPGFEFEPTPRETTQPAPTAANEPFTPADTEDGRRQQAGRLLTAARADVKRRDFAAARRKAEQADKLDVEYGLFDDRPELVLAEIDRLDLPGREPVDVAVDFDTPTIERRPAPETVSGADFFDPPTESTPEITEPTPAGPPVTSGTKDTASALLREARSALASGDYESARSKALAAQRMDVVYGLFDDRPELLLADVERLTKTATIAGQPKPAAGQPGGTPTQPEPNPAAQQAQSLLAAARSDLTAGNLDEARRKAEAARNLEVAYDLFEDRPDLVIADVDAAIAARNIAREEAATPAAPAEPNPSSKQAQALLASAREDLRAGRYDAARQKAEAVQGMEVAYGLFEDRPDLVLADVDRLGGRSTDNIADGTPETAVTAPAEEPVAVDQPTNKDQALELLKAGRADLAAGRFEEAKAKAQQAESMKVAYGLFDDRPELLISDVDRQLQVQNIARTEPSITKPEPSPVSPEPAPMDKPDQAQALLAEAREALEAGNLDMARSKADEANRLGVVYGVFEDTPERVIEEIERVAGSEYAAKPLPLPESVPTPIPSEFEVVHPEGPTAATLFERGLAELRSGNEAAAYDTFLAAHESGQELDPVKSRQLQSFLRELAPRRQNVQLAGGERVEQFGPGEFPIGSEPGQIGEAERLQAVEFDRLRTTVLNAVYKAERMKEDDPEQALDTLDEALAEVNQSSQPEAAMATLVASLRRTRTSIESWKKIREPLLAQKLRNAEVQEALTIERENQVRIEQEFTELVDDFNELMRQRRYAEAQAVARQAREVMPGNPVAETLFYKSQLALRLDVIDRVKADKEQGIWGALMDVDRSNVINVGNDNPLAFPKDWADITKRRKGKYGTDARLRSPEEKRIESSLENTISLHFDEKSLAEIVQHLAAVANINIVLDKQGLEDVGIDTNQPVSINVEGIKLRNALFHMLEPFDLGYMVDHEVLKITSNIRQQGDLVLATYPVADLVVPIPNFTPTNAFSQNNNNNGWGSFNNSGNYSVPPMGGMQQPAGQAFFQVGDPVGRQGDPFAANSSMNARIPGESQVDFDSLIDLIVSTVEPDSWNEVAGAGSVRPNESTLSLVIRQTQQVHDEIADLLEQLRRLQDLQVTVEIRFITIADQFFERIGVDFDFDVQSSLAQDPAIPYFGTPLPGGGGAAGAGGGAAGAAGAGGAGAGGAGAVGVGGIGGLGGAAGIGGAGAGGGAAGGAGGAGAAQFFTPPPPRAVVDRTNYPKTGTVVGLANPGQFTTDLDVGFRQGSFQIGVPDFGGFNPDAGIQFGMAILSDIEAFLFIQAAQGDERSNIMFAPKVTLFNGQTATVSSNVQRPFVTSVSPTVGVFAVGFTPTITVLAEGVTVSVQAVISADRRFVRLTVAPSFNTITDVFAFSFQGGGGGGIGGGLGGGLGGLGGGLGGGGLGGGLGGLGGGLGGLGGGLGGGGLGGFGGGGLGGGGLGGLLGGGGLGGGGLGGGLGGLVGVGGIGGLGGGLGGLGGGLGGGGLGGGGLGGLGGGLGGGGLGGGGLGGGLGGAGAAGLGGGGATGAGGVGGGAGTVTVQQPVFEVVNVTTTVSVPDGGTVLLAGVKRLREGRTMAGVPILNKIPYVSRLFKNTGVGRDTVSLMLMVTPRIIIQEEEEELLGIEL